jgi:hypothetical protein
VIGLGASETALVVSATVKVPIATQERASRDVTRTPLNIRPCDVAVLANVSPSHLIGNALVAESAHQPVEYLACITISNGLKDTGLTSVSMNIVEKRQRSG